MHGRAARGNSRYWQGWKVSLALHTALGIAVLFTLWRAPLPDSLQELNTRTNGPSAEINVTICDEPAPKVRPLPAPPPKPLPAEILEPLPAPMPGTIADNHVRPAEMTGPKNDSNTGNPGSNGNSGFGSYESHLPVPLSSKAVVFVLDRSASMGIGNKMEIARREILATLSRMKSASRFQVVVYNRQVEQVSISGHQGMLAVAERNLEQLSTFLSDLAAEGGNDHLRGLREAIALQPDVICLLSDADDLTLAEVQTITNWNRGLSCIHAVTIGTAPSAAMQLLAKSNRGTCKMLEVK